MGWIWLHIGCVHNINPVMVYTAKYSKLEIFRIWIHPYLITIWMHNQIYMYIWPTLVYSPQSTYVFPFLINNLHFLIINTFIDKDIYPFFPKSIDMAYTYSDVKVILINIVIKDKHSIQGLIIMSLAHFSSQIFPSSNS